MDTDSHDSQWFTRTYVAHYIDIFRYGDAGHRPTEPGRLITDRFW